MIKAVWLCPFLLLFSPIISAQDLVEDPSELTQIFDAGRIAASGTKIVTANYSQKYDLRPIDSSMNIDYLFFGTDGKLNSKIEVRKYTDRMDTVKTEIYRNANGFVTLLVKSDLHYTSVLLSSYKEERLSGQQFYQMPRNTSWNENLNPSTLVWMDSMVWVENHAQVYNFLGFPYRKMVVESDHSGRITNISHYDQSGKIIRSVSYQYEGGNLTEIKESSGQNDVFESRKELQYRQEGLKEVQYFKSGELQYIRRINYKSNGLPEFDLNRSEYSKIMKIIRFEYQ